MAALNKPNVILPLSPSYNERGIDGFAATVTNSLDQRKINVQYEPVKNAMTGKTTLYVTPRPGVSRDSAFWGSDDQTAYLISLIPGASSFAGNQHWVFAKSSGGDLRASNTTGTDTVVISSTTSRPKYVDRTNIGGTVNLVLQTGINTPTQAFYASNIAAWSEISASDFPAAIQRGKLEHLDGYASILTTANRIVTSDLNSLANWTATSYVTKQIREDQPIGLARLGNQILAFGANTVEVLRNAGTKTGSPLQFIPQLAARVGMDDIAIADATHYYAELDQRLYFLGRSGGDRTEGLWTYNGATFEKVSPPSIDRILISATNKYSVNTVFYGGQEAIAISLSLPNVAQRWLMFFPRWNEWFEWTSDVFQPVNAGKLHLPLSNGTTGGDRMYQIAATNSWIDHSTDYTREIVFNMPTDGNQLKRMPWAGVVADSQSAGASASAGVYLQMAFANNADFSFGAARQIDLRGRKKQIYRCGAFRDRAVKITHSGNAQFRIQNFVAKVL